MQGFGKLSTYFQHKRSFNFEKYLNLKSKDDRVILAKFRISNHCLRVETGRYERKINSHGKNEILPRCERICQYCTSGSTEDELHFLLECPLYNNSRGEFLNMIFKTYPNLALLNNADLLTWIMSNENPEFTVQLCQYLIVNLNTRKQHTC